MWIKIMLLLFLSMPITIVTTSNILHFWLNHKKTFHIKDRRGLSGTQYYTSIMLLSFACTTNKLNSYATLYFKGNYNDTITTIIDISGCNITKYGSKSVLITFYGKGYNTWCHNSQVSRCWTWATAKVWSYLQLS